MNLVTIDNLTHHYSERVLLDGVNLLINEGDRIGLIGPNGSGKTTLLKLIAGLETAVSGTVTIWGGVRVHYSPQTPQLDPSLTVLETIFQSDAPLIQLLRRYESASLALQQKPEDADRQAHLIALSNEMAQSGGWAAEAEAKAVLTRLGITRFDTAVGQLSGGQQKRVALAQTLLTPTDLLILDEPTNHIDADTVAWLETHLTTMKAALLMVTHDRYFLDRVVNRIVELDRQQLVSYPGNYGRYLELRAERQAKLTAAEDKRQALLRQELAWLQRGAQARTTKQKARQQRVAELQEIQVNQPDRRIAMALASRRLGRRVLEAEQISKTYGVHTLFKNLDLMLNPGDRIGILGPNGAGKTTLLDILAEKVPPDSGTVSWGDTVHLGYYDQHSAALRPEMKVLDFVETAAALIRTDSGERVEAAQMLEWFLFTRPQQQAKISSLSGGERRRLYLLYILAMQPNVLFLDEPTNDLDVQTLTVLEAFLDQFAGCLVVVSHDRYFLDRNVDFLVSLEDGVLGTRYPTPYDSYREKVDALPATTAVSEKPTKTAVAPTPPKRAPKLTYHQKKELAALEAYLPAQEATISQLKTAVNAAGSDYQKLQTLADELETAVAALETAELRWLELSELQDAADN